MNCFIISPTLKCGSTLLEWMLNQHPVVATNPIREGHGMGKMLDVMDWLPDNPHLENSPKILRPRFADATRRWYHELVNPDDIDFSGSRFTEFTSCRFLRWLFPDDPMLVIVRDPRDAWLSYKRWLPMHGAKGGRIPTVTAWFDQTYARLFHSIRKVSGVHVVHFEDLIADHQSVMDGCCDHLGLARFVVDLRENDRVYANMTSFPRDAHRGNGLETSAVDRIKDADPSEMIEIRAITEIMKRNDLGDGFLSRYRLDRPSMISVPGIAPCGSL
jgi:hypothetical protein